MSIQTLECHQRMSDLRAHLSARFEAHDELVNSTHTKIACEHVDQLQPRLQVELATKKCSLAKLVGNCSELHRRTRDYQDRALDVRKYPLATIAEDQQNLEPKLP